MWRLRSFSLCRAANRKHCVFGGGTRQPRRVRANETKENVEASCLLTALNGDVYEGVQETRCVWPLRRVRTSGGLF